MTIRQYIKRRVRWGFGTAIVSWLFVALMSNMRFGEPQPGYLAFIGVFGFMGASISFMLIRCPRCRNRIGQTIAVPATLRLFGPRVNFCPYCGVNLDEPIHKPVS